MHSNTKRRLLFSLAAAAALTGAALALRRQIWLDAYRREIREKTAPLKEADGWTADGYIKDQDHLYYYTYRTSPASGNGCGPVAAFDLRRHEGHDVRFLDVLEEMDAMHRRNVPGPTLMPVMRQYLNKYLPGGHEVHGAKVAIDAAERSRMGLLRYHEESVPHFIPYFRVADGQFRFFNVSDGQEDFTAAWADFAAEHIQGNDVKLIWWE